MTVKLVSVTSDAERQIAYCTRVSSEDQNKEEFERLLKYCYKHKHWSIFEHAHMTVEINTTRAIAAQILRHRSFTFQEFSQRYAAVDNNPIFTKARRQDLKNRQNSIDDMDKDLVDWWYMEQQGLWDAAYELYNKALEQGIAKEVARNVLPLMAPSKMYMTGNIRSWIHYLELRTDPSTQLEHREIALAIKEILVQELPVIGALINKT